MFDEFPYAEMEEDGPVLDEFNKKLKELKDILWPRWYDEKAGSGIS